MRAIIIPGLFLFLSLLSCAGSPPGIRPGAMHPEDYVPMIGDKSIALVANHASLVDGSHLVDTLLNAGIPSTQIKAIFCPEHGFRGKQAAGEHVEDGRDPLTGIPVISLYGNNRKPTPEQMEGIELVLFDLQDVGARFFTYISTLHYVMEACAEADIPLVVLDRPNPNGGYVDGPILEDGCRSFVGMHPIPVVYGLTIGELARMINGEGWLHAPRPCALTVIPCSGYHHGSTYSLPVRPSPNLANDHAIRLYPSTCFFEGTVLSEGRGSPWPFEVFGHPDLEGSFSFTPVSIPGVSGSPKHEGLLCHGKDLRDFHPGGGWHRLHLSFLLEAYEAYPRKAEFFTDYIDLLAGTPDFRRQIEAGWDEERIRESWQPGLDRYLENRKQYLLYED